MISIEEMGAHFALSVASQLADKVIAGMCAVKPPAAEPPTARSHSAVAFILGVFTTVAVGKARECCKRRRQKVVAVPGKKEIGVQSPCANDRELDKLQFIGRANLKEINKFGSTNPGG